MRFTKIIATVGPASASPGTLHAMAKRGVNVVRLNFSHGDRTRHGRVIRMIHAYNRLSDAPLGIMLDTKGPEIRTAEVPQPVRVHKGEPVMFSFRRTERARPNNPVRIGRERGTVILVDYRGFAADARNAKRILIDNGVLEFRIEEIRKDAVVARALENGSVGSRRHVNIPGAQVRLPSFTRKDWSDISFCLQHDIDFFAISFLRSAKDVRKLRSFLERHGSSAEIIAKIETVQAVENIASIVDAADGIMVARGDLGVELPYEHIPRIQEEIVSLCRRKGKTVIVATHMLESMIENPIPTRAEVTDVAHAAISQADATMLSGETAAGRHPLKAVEAMDRILRSAEAPESAPVFPLPPTMVSDELPRLQQALAASILSAHLRAQALIVISKHGLTAKAVSRCRPRVPILAFTDSQTIQRHLLLAWGVCPFVIPFSQSNPERTVALALQRARERKLIRRGDRVVVVSDIRPQGEPVMTIQIRTSP